MEKHPSVFLVTGKRGEGKTTFLIDLTRKLIDMELTVDGILAPASSGREIPDSYILKHIKSGRLIPLCNRKSIKGWTRVGPFYFNPVALDAGNRILTHPGIVYNDLVILDEIGRFELEGKIWAGSLSWLLRNATCPLVLSARDTFTEQIIKKWDLPDVEIYTLSQSTTLSISETILQRINRP
jgi:nucleoside-triphosphatase